MVSAGVWFEDQSSNFETGLTNSFLLSECCKLFWDKYYLWECTHWTREKRIHFVDQLSLNLVVYNCFFVETGQAKSQQSDVILNAVWKQRTRVTAGGFQDWGGVLCWVKNAQNLYTGKSCIIKNFKRANTLYSRNIEKSAKNPIMDFKIFLCYSFIVSFYTATVIKLLETTS